MKQNNPGNSPQPPLVYSQPAGGGTLTLKLVRNPKPLRVTKKMREEYEARVKADLARRALKPDSRAS